MAEVVRVRLPLRIVSVANLREHWAKKAARTKTHRLTAWAELRASGVTVPSRDPLRITLTRIAPRKLDTDNLSSGCKAVRDGVADWLGCADNHPTLTWAYAQRRGAPKEYAAEVLIERGAP